MPRLDVQGDLRSRLARALDGTEVRTSVPDPRPATLVVVRREGGPRENALVDRPGVGIECWAPTEAEAYELCDRVDGVMQSLPFRGGYASVRLEAMRSDPDARTRSPRWYASYTIRTFKPTTKED